MTLVLITLFVGVLAELYLFMFPPKLVQFRHLLLIITVLLVTFSATSLMFLNFTLFTFGFGLVCIYRIINLLRFSAKKINEKYLHRVSFTTSTNLLLIELLILAFWICDNYFNVGIGYWAIALSALQLLVAFVFLVTTIRRIQKTKMHKITAYLPDSKLPSITVAVPARDENDELERCIQCLVSSDYPKLEIIVLDDCSQGRKTPEIIKSFAHEGVRFIQGEEPHSTWYAKNHAYAQLAYAASGEIIMFINADVMVKPNTISQLVETMLARKKRMVSIIPIRNMPNKIQVSLSQSIRYLWELSPPRKLFKRPPIMGSCWLIYKNDLQKYGGFAAVSRMVVPEVYFARVESRDNDQYSLMRSNENIGLTSGKTMVAQRETAIRVRYPALHRKPEMVLIVSILELGIIAGAFGLTILGFANIISGIVFINALAASIIYTIIYSLVAISTKVNSWYVAPFLALPAVLFDVYLMNISMFKYEFSEVMWKGRNVCVPVMHYTLRQP